MNLKRTKKLNKKHSLHIAFTFIWYIIDLFIDSFFIIIIIFMFGENYVSVPDTPQCWSILSTTYNNTKYF